MSLLTPEQYEEKIRDAITILNIPTVEDAKLRSQTDACNRWLETPQGKEMLLKVIPVAMPYFGNIMEYVATSLGETPQPTVVV